MKELKRINWNKWIDMNELTQINQKEWIEMNELKWRKPNGEWRNWNDGIKKLKHINQHERIEMKELQWMMWDAGIEMKELTRRNWI